VSQFLLSFVQVKNGRTVLRADVLTLTVILGRVVDGEEDV
jgi:hypothetical protein